MLLTVSATSSTITYTPGPTTSVDPGSFCTGGGAAGAVVTCTQSIGANDVLLLDMGPGNDTVHIGSVPADVAIFLAGGDGDDKLYGSAHDESIDPGLGNDVADAGAGRDRLYHGLGIGANLGYRGGVRQNGVRVDLALGVVDGMFSSEHDEVTGFEEAAGTDDRDDFIGDAGNNTFIGMGGWDAVDGGLGDDRAWTNRGAILAGYARRPGPLKISVSRDSDVTAGAFIAVTSPGGGTEVDRYGPVEYVLGSAGNDTMTTSTPIELHGGPGDDTITGSDGRDSLYGNAGADKITGGTGIDFLNGDDGTRFPSGDPMYAFLTGASGDDTIDARGTAGEYDYISCGGGTDTLILDSGYALGDCEVGPKPPPDPPRQDPPPPIFTPSGTPPRGTVVLPPVLSPPVIRLGHTRIVLRRPGTAAVKGEVTRANGAVIPEARVVLRNGRRVLAKGTTDARGRFALRVRVRTRGSHTIKVTATDPSGVAAIGATATIRVARLSG
ncbi:MAG: hypothetical protein JHC95_17565 [Solirubrobacteraceae bacterium]|nr:hypothetical protein [Solirubrobacteraceae bacterium]